MKIAAALIFAMCLTACAAPPQPLGAGMAQPLPNCSVRVYSSLESAKAGGTVEEVCLISGTSSGSFSHTVATAIEKHKDKACGCGADKVYIQAQDAGTLGTASVTLVGFRYKQ